MTRGGDGRAKKLIKARRMRQNYEIEWMKKLKSGQKKRSRQRRWRWREVVEVEVSLPRMAGSC